MFLHSSNGRGTAPLFLGTRSPMQHELYQPYTPILHGVLEIACQDDEGANKVTNRTIFCARRASPTLRNLPNGRQGRLAPPSYPLHRFHVSNSDSLICRLYSCNLKSEAPLNRTDFQLGFRKFETETANSKHPSENTNEFLNHKCEGKTALQETYPRLQASRAT